MKYREFWRVFCADESGATAVEYGLILAGICIAVIAAVSGVGEAISALFIDVIVPALN
ncbi:MAG: Flp family type IVb pilin [Parvibaculum sp.]|nr:Flp family type IVb pilin [Parvibaculum sp.]